MLQIGQHILNSPYLLAPMAGVSEMPFRCIAMQMGAGLATTELISAKGLAFKNERSKQYLAYNPKVEIPYSLQLFGGEIDIMAKAAVLGVEHGADIIDINMGCPVKKVTKTGAGSALLSDTKRAAELIVAMRQAVGENTPITAKIRSGWDADHINCVDMAKALEDAGCAALAIHARTRAQGYSGQANWDLIAQMKDAVDMPIIGNGDVCSVNDAKKMLEQTHCDGVMIGRGALGNPWIFKGLIEGNDCKPTADERLTMILRHLNEHIDLHIKLAEGTVTRYVPPEIRAIRSFRSHLVWYSKGIKNAGSFREQLMQIDDKNELLDKINAFFLESHEGENIDQDDGINFRQAFG